MAEFRAGRRLRDLVFGPVAITHAFNSTIAGHSSTVCGDRFRFSWSPAQPQRRVISTLGPCFLCRKMGHFHKGCPLNVAQNVKP